MPPSFGFNLDTNDPNAHPDLIIGDRSRMISAKNRGKFLRLKQVNKCKAAILLWKTRPKPVENYVENQFITIQRSWKV